MPNDLCTAQLLFQLLCLDRVTKTMSVALLLMNNLDNSKQKRSNLLSPAPPPYSWSLLGKLEGPAPPPSSKISWSFDLAWNPLIHLRFDWIPFKYAVCLFHLLMRGEIGHVIYMFWKAGSSFNVDGEWQMQYQKQQQQQQQQQNNKPRWLK